ncbi:MAG: glycogen synthase [Flavobacteriales bacterium]|nr:glycogen/starch synthase [Bacteroidales bacterium AH-315-I05]PCJ89691.1 MAG: glycogen synthase [Flavobacteriales bacterium]
MEKTRVLYISQEIHPYLPETKMSLTGRHLPQGIQERGKEIRTFMPRYGCINERRHQLHEVIRLSGMNMIIDDGDHPLIIKVASIQPVRMQVYFIDNEEYFQRKAVLEDEKGKMFSDNDERSIFFCRGVLETVKKLGWTPDIVHCHGWMSALIPLYIKKSYHDDPVFANSKVIYSIYNDAFSGGLNKNFAQKTIYDGIESSDVQQLENPTYANVNQIGIDYADAVIVGDEDIQSEVQQAISSADKPVLGYQKEEEYIDVYAEFYDEILEENSVLVD